MSEPRILIISHGHPDFSVGGGEIAAHAHWSELRRRGIEAMLVSRVAKSPGHAGATFFSRSADGLEVLFSPPLVDHFRHTQTEGRVIYENFRALLDQFRPNVVHFQHYTFVGVEAIREVRKYSADVPIIVTLHEFLGICYALGQMVKTNGMLCMKSAPLDCHLCFPDISPQNFFMRELFIKSFFNLVDRFVCPSQFLCDRYVAWGLPAEKMLVLENGQPPQNGIVAPEPDHSQETRFVVLGQLSRRKGTMVVLDAVRLLPKRLRKSIRIEIHGSLLHAEEEFKNEFENALKGLEDTVTFCGAYQAGDVSGIIRSAGWVVVPSIWWENSPLVIQEAFAAGRPVICSNIGGMAEKVTNNVNGVHFRVNSAADLAARIEECATNPDLWKRLRAGVPNPPTIRQTVDKLLALYGEVAASKASRSHRAQAPADHPSFTLPTQPVITNP